MTPCWLSAQGRIFPKPRHEHAERGKAENRRLNGTSQFHDEDKETPSVLSSDPISATGAMQETLKARNVTLVTRSTDYRSAGAKTSELGF